MFEPRFLEETRQLYLEEGNRKKTELEVPDYLIHSERRIAEEQDRCLTCMDHSTLLVVVRMILMPRPSALLLTISLSVQEVWGAIPGSVKPDTVLPSLMFLWSCVVQALSCGDGSCYFLHASTYSNIASILFNQFHIDKK